MAAGARIDGDALRISFFEDAAVIQEPPPKGRARMIEHAV
jgi:hypothetical protein